MRLCFDLFFVVVIVVIKNLVDLETLIQFRIIIWRKKYYICIHIYPEKAMAPHSSTLAWKIPWTEESGGL